MTYKPNLKTKVYKTRVYKIEGMTCDSCAKMIELDLEDAGHKCKCSYVNETLEVETEHKMEELMELVKKAGYTLSKYNE